MHAVAFSVCCPSKMNALVNYSDDEDDQLSNVSSSPQRGNIHLINAIVPRLTVV